MLKQVRIGIGILLVGYIIYSFLYGYHLTWLFALLGAYLLTTGIIELQQDNRKLGYLDITLSICSFIILLTSI
ncbi:DUF3953 domain-containing protein [Oceanobacillus halotolerans]|uniref:DUF3953 domain-containing protein n=1 Tax=Oceanobacillus halotolerans TaxID=2663380 RepID=UPI0013DA200F|nr:DUF3953 domain-containing protein [Oceanobacillus halotolerans]